MGSGQGDGPLEDCTLASVTGAFKQALCHHGTVRSRMGLSATPPPDLRPDRRAADGLDLPPDATGHATDAHPLAAPSLC